MASADLQSKIDRVIAYYLIHNNATTGCTWTNTNPYNSSRIGNLPGTEIGSGDTNAVMGSAPGNFLFSDIPVILRDAAKVQPANQQGTTPDPESAKVAATTRFTNIMNLLNISDDGGQTYDFMRRLLNQAAQNMATLNPADNGDMADFCITYYWFNGFTALQKQEEKNGVFWIRGCSLDIEACNAAQTP